MRAFGPGVILGAAALLAGDASLVQAQGAAPLLFRTLAPCNLLDTQSSGAAVQSGEVRSFEVWGHCDIPTTAQAVYLNVTAVAPTAAGTLQVWGDASAAPATSVLSLKAGSNGAAGALVNLVSGMASVKPQQGETGATHVLVEVAGYFEEAAGYHYHGVVPCRIADTRMPEGGGPALADGQVRRIAVASKCQVPDDARAVAAMVTVMDATGAGRLDVAPAGGTVPASRIPFEAGATRSHGALLPLGPGGLDWLPAVAGGGTVHMTLDVVGYYR